VLLEQCSLRILDWFFSEGSRVLFVISLSILHINQTALLQTEDGGEVIELLRSLEIIDTALLFNVCSSIERRKQRDT
jgi:hypothetical protein